MNWVIIDLETTGFSPVHDKIIEIAAIRLNENGERSVFHTLIDPEMKIPAEINRLTGISDELVSGQPLIGEIIPDLVDFIGDAVPVAHNADFDGGFLKPYLGISPDRWLDTVELSKMAFPMLESYALANIVTYFGIDLSQHHRALADAEATTALFLLIDQSFQTAEPGLIAAWQHLFDDEEKKYSVYRHFFDRYESDPFSELYMPPAIKDDADREEEKNEKIDDEEKVFVDEEELSYYFQDENGLKAHVSGYQDRESQQQMAQAVAKAFNHDEFLLAEAGTGTGKTIAYLMPSILYSLKSGRPVIISTHTIHLQDQILNKDIPELNHCFHGNLRASLLKGRGHYLCYRKWESEYEKDHHDQVFFMARLLPWVSRTRDGDSDGLNFNAYEKRLWQDYSAVSENCLGYRCPYFHNRCFVRRARKKGERSNLIVINHSLLLTDAMMGSGILPNSEYLIIDEAHQLENVAENTLGGSFSMFDHSRVVNETLSVLQKLLRFITFSALYSGESSKEELKKKENLLTDFCDDLQENRGKGENAFGALKSFLDDSSSDRNMYVKTVRISEKIRLNDFWHDSDVALNNLLIWYEEKCRLLNDLSVYFENELDDDGNEAEKIRFALLRSEWQRNTEILNAFLKGEGENIVSWIEAGNERTVYPLIKIAPLRIDRDLAEVLYQVKSSVVFVSATLSVKQSFSYFRETCGIDLSEHDVSELLLPSPFDYSRQAALITATDVPLVGTVSDYEYLERISEAIEQMVLASKGRALVLFTSHAHLREVFKHIRDPLENAGISVLAHELSGSRSTLLNKMRENNSTVILGANSFWEGIDVSGENLSLLIIVRLPFWPPDIPTIAAKNDLLKSEKRNAFSELSLPQAVIRFKQGFGRLLRKEDDRGVVCVLDKRIYEKRYGSDFVESLPVPKLYHGTVKEIVRLIETKL